MHITTQTMPHSDMTKATPPLIDKMTGTYNGAELKPCSTRPGSMDAFDKPSLVSGERVPHRKIEAMSSNVRQSFLNNQG